MTDKELDEIFEAAKKNVTVSCDEYHAHSARRGCLSSKDPKDVTICKLIEALKGERALIREAMSRLLERMGETLS